METGTSSKPCYYDDLSYQLYEDGTTRHPSRAEVTMETHKKNQAESKPSKNFPESLSQNNSKPKSISSDEDSVLMSLDDSFEVIQLNSDSEIGSDLFVDKMMNESAGICDVIIKEARQPKTSNRKSNTRRKLKISLEKYKDMSEDEDSVFSDVPEDEDLSEIDEDWLNADIDSDSSCISRLDDPLMSRSKEKTNGKKSFDDVIRSNRVKKSNVIIKSNDVIKSNYIKKADDVIKSNDFKKTNDVIKSNYITKADDVIKSNDIKKADDVIKSNYIKKADDVIKKSSLKLVNEESEDDETRNVGTILSMWEQKRSDEKKNVCEVEQFDSGTIGRLKGAKSLFEKLSCGVSQTLPRSWKSSRPSILTSSDRYNEDKILKRSQDDVEMTRGSKINSKDQRAQNSPHDHEDVVIKSPKDLKDLKTSREDLKIKEAFKDHKDTALQSPQNAVGDFKDHYKDAKVLETSKYDKFHETPDASKDHNKDLKVTKKTSENFSNSKLEAIKRSSTDFESANGLEEPSLPAPSGRSLSSKIEKINSFERPESSCNYSGNFTDEDLSDVSSLSSASTDEEDLDDLLL